MTTEMYTAEDDLDLADVALRLKLVLNYEVTLNQRKGTSCRPMKDYPLVVKVSVFHRMADLMGSRAKISSRGRKRLSSVLISLRD